MAHQQPPGTYIFRGYLPIFLIKNGLILACGAACLALAQLSPWWLLGVASCLVGGIVNAIAYSTTAVLIRGDDVVLRTGMFTMVEVSFLAWQHELRIEQSLLGRILDFGTIRHESVYGPMVLRRIAMVHALRLVIADRRQQALVLTLPRRATAGRQLERVGRGR